MKKIKLHNGKIIQFPEDTPDEIIKKSVQGLLGVRESETPEIANAIKELAQKLDKPPKKDTLSPAIKKLVDSNNKHMSDLVSSVNEIARHVSVLALKVEETMQYAAQASKDNTKALGMFVEAYKKPKEIIRDEEGRPIGIQ